MKRPAIPHKPPAPSVHPTLGAAISRARRLSPDKPPANDAELFDDIERHLGLRRGWLKDIATGKPTDPD